MAACSQGVGTGKSENSFFFFFLTRQTSSDWLQCGSLTDGAIRTTLHLQWKPVFIFRWLEPHFSRRQKWRIRHPEAFPAEFTLMTPLPAAIVLGSIPSPCRERELSPARLVDFQQCVLLNVSATHAKRAILPLCPRVYCQNNLTADWNQVSHFRVRWCHYKPFTLMFYRAPPRRGKWKQTRGLKLTRATTMGLCLLCNLLSCCFCFSGAEPNGQYWCYQRSNVNLLFSVSPLRLWR